VGDVTRLPGELSLLSAVVASPADDVTKLVYADWLEEHGDPRGPFLRRFVHAVQGGQELPGGDSIDSAWQELAGLSLLRRLREGGLTADRDAVMALALPTLTFQAEPAAEEDIAVGVTKFGGRPDLPAGTLWPRCDRGPLEFLVQLDMAEFQDTCVGRSLPPGGLLSFFMYHNYSDDEYGNGRDWPPEDTGGLCVIHTLDTSALARLDPPDELSADRGRPRKPCRVTFREGLDLPDPPDSESDLASERYAVALARLQQVPAPSSAPAPDQSRRDWHQLLGHSHVTVLCDDPTPGPQWRQLIGLASDDALGWGWGDGHRLFWYVKSDDLSRGRFGNTWATDG